jgi:hypothetical protein
MRRPRRSSVALRTRWAGRLTLPSLVAVALGAGLLAPSPALATFTRPFLHHITSGSSGSFTFPTGPRGPESGGIALDGTDSLWVSDGTPPSVTLDEFGAAYQAPANEPQAGIPVDALSGAASLAIERPSGRFYLTGSFGTPAVEAFESTGALAKRWLEFGGHTHVAVDNSSEAFDPSKCTVSGCTVYVSHELADPQGPVGDGLPHGIEKFNSKGEAADFVNAKGQPIGLPYVDGNEITGPPAGAGGCSKGFGGPFQSPGAIAVDPEGNIYVLDAECSEDTPAVIEYKASGEFVRIFTGAETPGIRGNLEEGGFGGMPEGIAVDPVSGHLLVSVSQTEETDGAKILTGAVDEFDTSTGGYLSQITETTEGTPLQAPLEVAIDSHGDLYVVDDQQQPVIDVYGPGHFLAKVRPAEATAREPSSAVLNGSVNPESLTNPAKTGLSGCRFQYVTEEAFEQNIEAHGGQEGQGFADLSSGGEATCVPTSSEIPADSDWHAVQAQITGLTSGTTYRYRLVATTPGALGGEAAGGAVAFTAPHTPVVDSSSASDLSSTFADMHAVIDPQGADTTYHFEYVDEASFSSTEYADAQVTSAIEIGSGGPTGSSQETVVQQVGDLVPGTTYHFRVVASNRLGTTYGTNETFTTLPSPVTGLPDGRGYELVTPANKGGGSDMFGEPETDGEFYNYDVGVPAESGDGFLLETHAGFGSFPGNEWSSYVFSRSPAGWSYTALTSPSLGVQSVAEPSVFDPADLSEVAIDDLVGSEASAGGTNAMNLLGPPGGPYTTLHIDATTHGKAEASEETRTVGASHDLSEVFLDGRGTSPLCPGAEKQKHEGKVLWLCEWSGDGLELVSVNSEGSPVSSCGSVLGAGRTGGKAHDAVSTNGSRVVFTAPDPYEQAENAGAGCWNGGTVNAPQLYMRSGGKTIELSAPESGTIDPTGQHPAEYVGAAEDGSRVFFITETWLTANHPTTHDMELYEYDTETDKLTRVAPDPGGAHIYTVPAVSAGGTAVYFTAFAALAPNAPALQEPAEVTIDEGSVNLYRYDTTSGAITYIDTISTLGYPNSYGACGLPEDGVLARSTSLCPKANWYTTPDGRYLLFSSSSELTGYDTAGPCKLFENGSGANGHCEELYRYDATTGGVICVSCDPSGARPVSNALFARSAPAGPDNGPVTAMSDDGAYVFFDTADALVPQDTNSTLDVYEWHEGHIGLISSGKDPSPSFFLGASPDGANVFFGTHANLVPQDTDTSGDIYDARICTAVAPCIKPAEAGTAACEGDACQNPQPAPVDTAPGSLTFSGAGNFVGEIEAPPAATKPTPLTNAQKLTKALKTCKKKKRKVARKKCESQARTLYGKKANKKTKKTAKKAVSVSRGGSK